MATIVHQLRTCTIIDWRDVRGDGRREAWHSVGPDHSMDHKQTTSTGSASTERRGRLPSTHVLLPQSAMSRSIQGAACGNSRSSRSLSPNSKCANSKPAAHETRAQRSTYNQTRCRSGAGAGQHSPLQNALASHPTACLQTWRLSPGATVQPTSAQAVPSAGAAPNQVCGGTTCCSLCPAERLLPSCVVRAPWVEGSSSTIVMGPPAVQRSWGVLNL